MHRLTQLALRWPLATILLAALGSALGGWSAAQAPSSSGAHALIGSDHPAVASLEEFLREFGSGYPVIVAWSCEAPADPCRSALDVPSLEMARAVGEKLSESPIVRRVASPAHTPVVLPTADGIEIHRFVEAGEPNASESAVRAARSDRVWRRALISEDAMVGALVVESRDTSPETQVALVSSVEAAIAPHQRAGFRFFLSGNPLFHVASQREAMAEAAVIGAATGAVIALCFVLLLRSWQSVIGVLASVGLATGFGLSGIALFGWAWDPLTSAAPTLILVMGCADAVHYLTAYWSQRGAGRERRDALLRAARETGVPCAMTTATSASGLVSFVGTESIGFAHFGAITALGVIACLVLTFTVLPALLSILPDTRRHALHASKRWEGLVARLIEFPIQRRRPVLLLSAAAAVLGFVGLTHLTTDAHPLSYWREGHATRASIEFVSERLTSIEGVEIGVTLPGAVEEGRQVERLAAFETALGRTPSARGTRSALTIIEAPARALGAERLSSDNAGEVLTLFSMSDASLLDQWISLDHRTLRFSLSTEALGVDARNRLLEYVGALTATLPRDWTVVLTGPSVLQRSIDRVVQDSALQAFSGTSLIVGALVMIFLGSVRWGVLAMIPNLLPMVVLFGLMGFVGVALDAGTALVAPIAVGIAVDDTIHFLHAFAGERRRGASSMEATRAAGRRVGRAIVTTSGTLAAGFLAMLVSRFQSMANIGLLSAAAILSAFAAELLVLPALIAWGAREPSEAASPERGRALP